MKVCTFISTFIFRFLEIAFLSAAKVVLKPPAGWFWYLFALACLQLVDGRVVGVQPQL